MTSTAVPGQRAAQQPMTAATQANAALGRLAQPTGTLTSELRVEVDGQWWVMFYPDQNAAQHWRSEATGAVFADYPGPDPYRARRRAMTDAPNEPTGEAS